MILKDGTYGPSQVSSAQGLCTSWLGCEIWLCHLSAYDCGQSIYLPVPQFPYLKHGANDDNTRIYLTGL